MSDRKDSGLYINGEFESITRPVRCLNRWSGSEIGYYQSGSAEDAIRAVDAASASLERPLSPSSKASIILKVAQSLREQQEYFAELITGEMGKPISASRAEVKRALDTLAFSAEEARRLTGEIVPLDATDSGDGTFALTIFEPRGVVAAITPFNFPLNLLLHKVAPAIAAGCPVVLKPSERTPLIAAAVVRLFHEAGLPAGWLNLVTGRPEVIVGAWQGDSRVSVVTFTGSSLVGNSLRNKAPEKHHVLELGSNTAMVVSSRADLKRAASTAAAAGFTNSGQACVSLQRIYVVAEVAEEFIGYLTENVKAVSAGDPYSDETIVGPLASDGDVERLVLWIREAVDLGATLAAGGRSYGKYIEPTLLLHANEMSKVICQEVFGPVITVNIVGNIDEAISRVNASEFGLNAGLFSDSLEEAMSFARKADVGTVLVNMAPSYRADNMPYGGVKNSGTGREGVKYAMRDYAREKLVVLHS
jgi:acyl-CoA reductase-like NAD-dependent aldehyde dehydrogenase